MEEIIWRVSSEERNIKQDKENTKNLIKKIKQQQQEQQQNEAISILEETPEMLEFIEYTNPIFIQSSNQKGIVIHSNVGYFLQNFNKEQICKKTNAVKTMLEEYYNPQRLIESVTSPVAISVSGNVSNMCHGSEIREGGSKSRRRHNRHRKHVRKTRRGRGLKSKSKRHVRGRKNKKNTYTRRR